MKTKLIVIPGWSCATLLWKHQYLNLTGFTDIEVVIANTHDNIEDLASNILNRYSEDIFLIGHSFGGLVAQEMARMRPERIKKMVLLSTWTGTALPHIKAFFQSVLPRLYNNEMQELLREVKPSLIYKNNDNALLNVLDASNKECDLIGLINQTKAILNAMESLSDSKKIENETLILYGRQDNYFNLDVQLELKKKFDHVKFVIIESCGHMVHLESQKEVTSLIRLWLQN